MTTQSGRDRKQHQRLDHAAVRRLQPFDRRPERRQQRPGHAADRRRQQRADRSEHQARRHQQLDHRSRPASATARHQPAVERRFVGQFGWRTRRRSRQFNGNNYQGTLQFGALNTATTGQLTDRHRRHCNGAVHAAGLQRRRNQSLTVSWARQQGVHEPGLKWRRTGGLTTSAASLQFGTGNKVHDHSGCERTYAGTHVDHESLLPT